MPEVTPKVTTVNSDSTSVETIDQPAYVPPSKLIDALELDTQVLFFLDSLYQIELEGERHWSLFKSLTKIDDLIFQGDFQRINLILENIDEKRVSFEIARFILMITFPVRAQLATRKPLVERVRLEANGTDNEHKINIDKYLKYIS